MRRVTAVICELNPLHEGHKYLIERAGRDSDVLVLVMSGSFTQRGTPAVFDKYTRAEAAVRAGADIVVELPFPWSSSGVESFARGGVKIASSMGADRLVFGSESGDISLIKKAAEIKNSPEFSDEYLKSDREERGRGSGELFDKVLASFGIEEEFGANDKLGMEYIRFGTECGIGKFEAIGRTDAPSASAIRKLIFSGQENFIDNIPEESRDLMRSADICLEREYDRILFQWARLYRGEADGILKYISGVAGKSADEEEFIRSLPTKKYTLARLRRALLSAITEAAGEPKTYPDFSYLLACGKRGREYLSEIKKSLDIALITKPADGTGDGAESSRRADELYEMCIKKESGWLTKKSPYIEK